MSLSALSSSTETIVNIVFGLIATTIGVVTVWQGHKVWKTWREHGRGGQGTVTPDIELGLQSTPTGVESQEPDEVVTASAPSAAQIGDVAASENANDGS